MLTVKPRFSVASDKIDRIIRIAAPPCDINIAITQQQFLDSRHLTVKNFTLFDIATIPWGVIGFYRSATMRPVRNILIRYKCMEYTGNHGVHIPNQNKRTTWMGRTVTVKQLTTCGDWITNSEKKPDDQSVGKACSVAVLDCIITIHFGLHTFH